MTPTAPASHSLAFASAQQALNFAEALADRLQIDPQEWPRLQQHAEQTAMVLAALEVDVACIQAAVMYALITDHAQLPKAVKDVAGREVYQLIQQVHRLRVTETTTATRSGTESQHEALRAMVLALVQDPRGIIIKLAHWLVRLRHSKSDPETAALLGQQTLDIFAPLANRLGLAELKWELEDLGFRYTNPAQYQSIAKNLKQRRIDRQAYIDDIREQLETALYSARIRADVHGRPKHIYSIWRKMQAKNLAFEQLYDLHALRVIVADQKHCYQALSVVHQLWAPVPSEYDDYISKPKPNNYQSLHTAVVGPEQRHIEVQVRDHAMHEFAERGVAAHWRYKEGGRLDPHLQQQIGWLRLLLDPEQHDVRDPDFIDQYRQELFSNKVYPLTPTGDVIELDKGATALDFAYAIHTEIGNHCTGAKVNGRIVSLDQALENGAHVEILTSRQAAPSQDWLQADNGYLATTKARQKVRQWFKERDYQQHLLQGQKLIEREKERLPQTEATLAQLARRFNYHKTDDLLAALGGGRIQLNQLLDSVVPRPTQPQRASQNTTTTLDNGTVQVLGIANLLTEFASCCQPQPPEPIIGFLSRGKGVVIHQQDCRDVQHLCTTQPERILSIQWNTGTAPEQLLNLEITALDRQGLLRDISALLNAHNADISEMASKTDTDGYVRMSLSVSVTDMACSTKLLAAAQQLPNVIDVQLQADSI